MDSFFTLPDGCSKYSQCSTCPFPDCEASIKDLKKKNKILDNRQKVLALHSQNVSADIIQQRTGYKDIRSIYRIIRKGG